MVSRTGPGIRLQPHTTTLSLSYLQVWAGVRARGRAAGTTEQRRLGDNQRTRGARRAEPRTLQTGEGWHVRLCWEGTRGGACTQLICAFPPFLRLPPLSAPSLLAAGGSSQDVYTWCTRVCVMRAQVYKGTFISAGGHDRETGIRTVATGGQCGEGRREHVEYLCICTPAARHQSLSYPPSIALRGRSPPVPRQRW